MDSISDHFNEISLRLEAAQGSTDPWVVAQLEFWIEQHRKAIAVALASRSES